jgi:hypothetical protein
MPPRTSPSKPEPKDPTGAKRQRDLRAAKPEVRAFFTPEQYAEVKELLASGEYANQAELLRKAVHAEYLRWKRKKP